MEFSPSANDFAIAVRVYYEDTDAGGVVYHSNYLKYFERCRTEWIRQAGHDQSALASAGGICFVARKTSCEYRRPARLDDHLTVGLSLERLTRVRLVFRQYARRGDEELVTGSAEIACVDAATLKPVPMPDFLYAKLEKLK